jgi:hypothetical protein
MTVDEKLALKHHIYTYKVDNSTSDSTNMRKTLMEKGLIRSEPEILEFLKNGYDDFEINIAKRIIAETPDKIFFNNCPNCNKLARTPYARQCRHCGHNWHNLTKAKFKLNDSFQITGRYFFLFGQITEGQINKGDFMDLTMLGLNKKPKIEAIDFALKKNENVWEDVALGTNDLSEDDKDYLKRLGAFGTPFDIISER